MSKPSKKKEVVEYEEEKSKSKKEEPKVVDYTEEVIAAYPNLQEAVGKVLVIKDVEVRQTPKGKVYYVHTEEPPGSWYTWSKVVGKQLEQLYEKYLKHGVMVRAKVIKVKDKYLSLAPPNYKVEKDSNEEGDEK